MYALGQPARVAEWLRHAAEPKDVGSIPATAAAFPMEVESGNGHVFEISARVKNPQVVAMDLGSHPQAIPTQGVGTERKL